MNWINVDDQLPEHGANVWYYFERVGVHLGWYSHCTLIGEEAGMKHEDFIEVFYGHKGFLGDDVTHWQPDIGQDKPERPEL